MKERHLHTITLMGTREIQCEALNRTECVRVSVCERQDRQGRNGMAKERERVVYLFITTP